MSKVYVLVLNSGAFMSHDIRTPVAATYNIKQLNDILQRVKLATSMTSIDSSFSIEILEYKGQYAKNICFIKHDNSDINYTYVNYSDLFIETPTILDKLQNIVDKKNKKVSSEESYFIDSIPIYTSLNKDVIKACLSEIHHNFNELEQEFFKKLDGSYYQELYS